MGSAQKSRQLRGTGAERAARISANIVLNQEDHSVCEPLRFARENP